jgi:hypothetical protein
MNRIAWLRALTVNVIVTCITVGVALGTTNFLANHVHWLGAYLIACPNHGWRGEPSPAPTPALHLPPLSRIGLLH